jgi:cytochrome c peroxidase
LESSAPAHQERPRSGAETLAALRPANDGRQTMRSSQMLRPAGSLRALLLAACLLILGAGASQAQPPPPPPPLTPLPPPPQPAGNLVTTAKANLGKALFWDEQLSSTRTMACGSCHQPARGGSDPRSTLAAAHSVNPGADGISPSADDIAGSPGVVLNQADGSLSWSPVFGLAPQVTGRHAPSAINAAYAPSLFWDGRATGTFVDPSSGATVLPNGGALESQAAGPPVSSAEMGHVGRDWNDVAARVTTSLPLALSPGIPGDLASWLGTRSYPELFAEAFGSTAVTASRILMAIASYERTLFSTRAPFDSVIAGTATLRPDEAAGMQLFGQLPCARCHAGALTSDNQFHYIGVRPAAEDSGRVVVSHNLADLGAMKTPSLRNVALRRSFMHDGRFSTLEQVVDFYDRGGDFSAPNKDPRIVPLHLTPLQKQQLVAFLGRPLIDPRVAGATAPFDRPSLFSQSFLVPEVLSGGVAGGSGAPPQPVALEPALAGNPAFTVGVFVAPGGAQAVLVVDEAEPPVDQGIPDQGSFARESVTLQGAGASDGFGSVTLAIPDDPDLYGRTLYGRWYVSDPGAAGGVAASPAFRFEVFGPRAAGVDVAVESPATRPLAVRLYAGQPNPFVASTLIRFDLLQPSRVKLAIYDLGGRLQRRLYERPFEPAGARAVTWDGRDGAGRAVPPGIYLYRLETEHETLSARVVRVR